MRLKTLCRLATLLAAAILAGGCDIILGLQRADLIVPPDASSGSGGKSSTVTSGTASSGTVSSGTASSGTASSSGAGGGCGFGPGAMPPLCPADPLWSKRFPTSGLPTGVVSDASGDVFLTGSFSSTIDFGGGPIMCAGADDAFLGELDPNGDYVFGRGYGDPNEQISNGAAVDAMGNVLIAGFFAGQIDFGAGPLTSAGGQDVFVAKLAPDASVIWAKRFGDASDQFASGVAVDDQGDVFVTGSFAGSIDFGGGQMTSAGGTDVFVAKLDPSGGHMWSARFGDTSNQRATGPAVDGMGALVIAGYFEGTVNLGGMTLVSAGGTDAFVAKFDKNGVHQWSQRFGDAADQRAVGPAVDGSGNVLLTGSFAGSIDFGGANLTSAGGNDVFVAKFDSGGNHQWSHQYGNPADQNGYGIAADPNGNALVVGSFLGGIDFGAGEMASMGGRDVFLAKLDPMGNYVWARRYGDAQDQDGYAVASDAMGNVLVAGTFSGAIDFGLGPLMTTMPNEGDAFLAKLAP